MHRVQDLLLFLPSCWCKKVKNRCSWQLTGQRKITIKPAPGVSLVHNRPRFLKRSFLHAKHARCLHFTSSYPCRGAQSGGCADAPYDASTASSDWPQLFERSTASADRVLRRNPVIEHRRLPGASRRDTGSRVAFALLTFLWRDKRKVSRRRAISGQQESKQKSKQN